MAGGIFGSIGKALFGDGGAKQIRRAGKKADQQLQEGYDTARPSFESAVSGFDPYTQSGSQFQQLYDDFMGLNGPEAQAVASEIMQSNPAFQAQMTEDWRGASRGLNAMGGFGSEGDPTGRRALAAQRVYSQNAMNFADKYRQGGAQGLGAAGAQGNALTNLGNFDYGYGATKAGKTINQGNALAQAGQVGMNNLIGLTGAIGSFFGGK